MWRNHSFTTLAQLVVSRKRSWWIERNHPFTTHSQLVVSRKRSWWKREKSFARKYVRHHDRTRRISLRNDWMQELDSEVAGGGEDSQQIQPRSKNLILMHGETCEWATTWFACGGNRRRCLVWLRKHKLKNGETCKKLCASVCGTFEIKTKTQTKT